MIKICISVTSHALDPPVTNYHTFLDPLPLESDVLYGRPHNTYIHTYIHPYIQTNIHTYIYTYIRTYIHTNTYLLLFGRLKKLEIVVDFQCASFSKKSTTTGGIKSLK